MLLLLHQLHLKLSTVLLFPFVRVKSVAAAMAAELVEQQHTQRSLLSKKLGMTRLVT